MPVDSRQGEIAAKANIGRVVATPDLLQRHRTARLTWGLWLRAERQSILEIVQT